jgi:hypothetical protein
VTLSDTDKREVCPRCGWVGRRAFQLERHDLCEAPDDSPTREPDEDDEDDEDDEEDGEDEEEGNAGGDDRDEPEIERRWSRAAARRRGIPPKKTLAVRRLTQLELAAGRAELRALGADDPYDRPRTRGHCRTCPVCQLVRDGESDGRDQAAWHALGRVAEDVLPGCLACGHRGTEVIFRSRPCVFVACKHSFYLDVSATGSIILNFPHLEPGQMPADSSCSLDLADRGAMTLEDIAVVTNLTRERIRQIELKAMFLRARPAAIARGLGPERSGAPGPRGDGNGEDGNGEDG